MASDGSGARQGSAVRGGRGGPTPPNGGDVPPFFQRPSALERHIDRQLDAQAKPKAEEQPGATPEGVPIAKSPPDYPPIEPVPMKSARTTWQKKSKTAGQTSTSVSPPRT